MGAGAGRTIAWISITPVKGLGLVALQDADLGPVGVRGNRRFLLVDDEGRLVNGKRAGALVQVEPRLDEEAGALALAFPDGSVVSAPIEVGDPFDAHFHRRALPVRPTVGPWSEALSSWSGRPLRLVEAAPEVTGVDRGPRGAVSAVSTASIEALRERAGTSAPVDPRRFRMLLGIDGARAHEEDEWVGGRVRFGQALVQIHGHVGRCVVTTQNPDSGERDLPTLDVLHSYRSEVLSEEPLPFGVYGEVVEPGRVRIGDPVAPEAAA